MRSRQLLYGIFTAFMLLAFSACRVKVPKDAPEKENIETQTPPKERKSTTKSPTGTTDKGIKNLIKEYQKQRFDYQTLEGKVSATIQTNTNKLSSKANLKIIKDKMLVLSVQPLLGIEMFRIIVTPQQITYIDRFNQYYFQESIEQLTGELKSVFNFHVLQSLFTNRLFLLSQESVTPEDATLFTLKNDEDNQHKILSEKRDFSTVINRFTLDNQQLITGNYIGDQEKTVYLEWQYTQFEELTKKILFPQTMNLKAAYDKQLIKLDIRFTSIDLDKNINISEEVPKRYKRITLKQLTQLISNIK